MSISKHSEKEVHYQFNSIYPLPSLATCSWDLAILNGVLTCHEFPKQSEFCSCRVIGHQAPFSRTRSWVPSARMGITPLYLTILVALWASPYSLPECKSAQCFQGIRHLLDRVSHVRRTVSLLVPKRFEKGLVESEHLRIWELRILETTSPLILNLSPLLSQEN